MKQKYIYEYAFRESSNDLAWSTLILIVEATSLRHADSLAINRARTKAREIAGQIGVSTLHSISVSRPN